MFLSCSYGADNPLSVSWCDSAWIPMLNPSNIMDYFSERSNPFFDRTCNNEIVKMQRLSPDQLINMTGLEYILLHGQEPILYVIRKQHRYSPTQVTPLADYYIIAGTIYQAPDLLSVINSRLISTVHHLQSAFEESSSYSRYHPSKGYTWDFKERKVPEQVTVKKETQNEVPSSKFQRERVDQLLGELVRKFPLPMPTQQKPVTDLGDKLLKLKYTLDDYRPTRVAGRCFSTIFIVEWVEPESADCRAADYQKNVAVVEFSIRNGKHFQCVRSDNNGILRRKIRQPFAFVSWSQSVIACIITAELIFCVNTIVARNIPITSSHGHNRWRLLSLKSRRPDSIEKFVKRLASADNRPVCT
uniref:Mediator of RNA polymerase II transcription subunit 6 n=1 Tax=Timema californicum TaxID=61474 RepID=A0A7R9J9G4_TIMCA|nr:unnamed protein product [Timema californicum]